VYHQIALRQSSVEIETGKNPARYPSPAPALVPSAARWPGRADGLGLPWRENAQKRWSVTDFRPDLDA
jgi:hypothetical protein